MPKVKCLLADDHTLVRQGIRRLLEAEPDIEVVGEAASAQDAVRATRELRPDLVLMDVTMPGLSPFEGARQIRRLMPATRVLFLTMHDDEEYVMECMQSGASGYVLKDAPSQQLVAAVREIHRGGKYVSPSLLGKMVDIFQSRRSEGPPRERAARLTPRERQILKLLAEGRSAKEVANLLDLSVRTVESHRFNLMRKIGVHNKVELLTYALRQRIIKIPTLHHPQPRPH
ncbi:MAG TPA: response regulator transcription factor [Terriglobales bacterium]